MYVVMDKECFAERSRMQNTPGLQGDMVLYRLQGGNLDTSSNGMD